MSTAYPRIWQDPVCAKGIGAEGDLATVDLVAGNKISPTVAYCGELSFLGPLRLRVRRASFGRMVRAAARGRRCVTFFVIVDANRLFFVFVCDRRASIRKKDENKMSGRIYP